MAQLMAHRALQLVAAVQHLRAQLHFCCVSAADKGKIGMPLIITHVR